MSLNWSIDKITKWQQVSVTAENGLQPRTTETTMTMTLAQALEDVLPYVESRLEDMAEDAETTNPEHRAEARRLYARALLKYRRAQLMLRREWLKVHKR